MDRVCNFALFKRELQQILFNPVRYIHPERLVLSSNMKEPRPLAVVNQMVLDTVPNFDKSSLWQHDARSLQLLKQWWCLPYICRLVGAQRLRQELAWQGRNLKLSSLIRDFIALPIWGADEEYAVSSLECRKQGLQDVASSELDINLRLQEAGLPCILNWQKAAPSPLIGRMQLMFSPALDSLFASCRRQLIYPELILILQAIEYAKNHPDDV